MKKCELISFGIRGDISIAMALFPDDLLFPHCNTWLTTGGGAVVPTACAAEVWKNVVVRPMKAGARMKISIPKGPSDPMNF